MRIKQVVIVDDLEEQETGGIEVTVDLASGERRWCFFMTPQALGACGDWIDGTTTRFHYGAAHMIIVAGKLTPDTIQRTLRQIEEAGDLELATRSVDE